MAKSGNTNGNKEIIIKISQKDKFYLTIILCLICVIVALCVLIPKFSKSNDAIASAETTKRQTTLQSNASQDEEDIDYTTQAVENKTTSALLKIKTIKAFSATASSYLTTTGTLNTDKLNITSSNFEPIEALAEEICTRYDTLTLAYGSVDQDVLANDEVLINKINNFFNMLAEIKK